MISWLTSNPLHTTLSCEAMHNLIPTKKLNLAQGNYVKDKPKETTLKI